MAYNILDAIKSGKRWRVKGEAEIEIDHDPFETLLMGLIENFILELKEIDRGSKFESFGHSNYYEQIALVEYILNKYRLFKKSEVEND
jgi:hypothetical protein